MEDEEYVKYYGLRLRVNMAFFIYFAATTLLLYTPTLYSLGLCGTFLTVLGLLFLILQIRALGPKCTKGYYALLIAYIAVLLTDIMGCSVAINTMIYGFR